MADMSEASGSTSSRDQALVASDSLVTLSLRSSSAGIDAVTLPRLALSTSFAVVKQKLADAADRYDSATLMLIYLGRVCNDNQKLSDVLRMVRKSKQSAFCSISILGTMYFDLKMLIVLVIMMCSSFLYFRFILLSIFHHNRTLVTHQAALLFMLYMWWCALHPSGLTALHLYIEVHVTQQQLQQQLQQ
jgi:hypothetical protein